MTDFESWLYRAVIVAALTIIWFFAKRILSELKEMNVNIKSISDKGIVHDGKLEMVQGSVKSHECRLNDHEDRIRETERKQDGCQYCRES